MKDKFKVGDFVVDAESYLPDRLQIEFNISIVVSRTKFATLYKDGSFCLYKLNETKLRLINKEEVRTRIDKFIEVHDTNYKIFLDTLRKALK